MQQASSDYTPARVATEVSTLVTLCAPQRAMTYVDGNISSDWDSVLIDSTNVPALLHLRPVSCGSIIVSSKRALASPTMAGRSLSNCLTTRVMLSPASRGVESPIPAVWIENLMEPEDDDVAISPADIVETESDTGSVVYPEETEDDSVLYLGDLFGSETFPNEVLLTAAEEEESVIDLGDLFTPDYLADAEKVEAIPQKESVMYLEDLFGPDFPFKDAASADEEPVMYLEDLPAYELPAKIYGDNDQLNSPDDQFVGSATCASDDRPVRKRGFWRRLFSCGAN